MEVRKEGDEDTKLPDRQKQRGTECVMGETGSKSGFGEGCWQESSEQGEVGRLCTSSSCGEGICGVRSQLGLQQSAIHTDLSKTQRQILANRKEPPSKEVLRIL